MRNERALRKVTVDETFKVGDGDVVAYVEDRFNNHRKKVLLVFPSKSSESDNVDREGEYVVNELL